MDPHLDTLVQHYWNADELTTNLVIFANILGALLLGLVVGYERTYHGRAAGMRTYGIVCMASCALTVFAGYPSLWFGGQAAAHTVFVDPTRVIQGIVTGVGFLGAGVIMRDGHNINGLTTAASIWASSAIGVLVAVGFYASAILLTLLSAGLMMWAGKIETFLPARPAMVLTLKFRRDFRPNRDTLFRAAAKRGYSIAENSLSARMAEGCQEWRFLAIEEKRGHALNLTSLAGELAEFDGVEEFSICHSRN